LAYFRCSTSSAISNRWLKRICLQPTRLPEKAALLVSLMVQDEKSMPSRLL
jgi:hypothetical protein